jgi:hypothetical protein
VATLVGPVVVLPGSVTTTIAVPTALVGLTATLRITLSGATVAGDITVTVEQSDDGVTWTPLAIHSARELLSTNADLEVVDSSSCDWSVTFPANMRLTAIATGSAVLTVEQV